MLDEVYEIEASTLRVYCEIDSYVDIIKERMLMFEKSKDNKYLNYIKIYKNKTIYCINGVKSIIKGRIIKTDLYPLFYNSIANIVLGNNEILIHSSVLCYNGKGILITGTFGSGKTSLCIKAKGLGMQILSADQSILSINDGYLKFEKGSKFMATADKKHAILNDIFLNQNKNIKIKLILNLIGLCDNGKVSFELIDNHFHKIKYLFPYCSWHSNEPLFTDESILMIDKTKIHQWLEQIDIPMYNVRGDMKGVIVKLKELIK